MDECAVEEGGFKRRRRGEQKEGRKREEQKTKKSGRHSLGLTRTLIDRTRMWGPLDQVSNVGGHLEDLSVVGLLEILEDTELVSSGEVDGNSLASETTRATNTMDVLLVVAGQIVVDDDGNLMDVDTASQKIGGDENTRRTRTELSHDNITLSLGGVSMSGRDGEVTLAHLLGQPVDLLLGVTENDSLVDVQGLIQIAKSIELPVLTLNIDVELTNTFEGKFILLNQNTDGVGHELTSDVESLLSHSSREQTNLNGIRKSRVDVVDLVLETARKHLVGLIENEDLDVVRTKSVTAQEIDDTTGGSDDDVDSGVQDLLILLDVGSSNASVALNLQVVSQVGDDLVDLVGQLTSGGKDESLDVGVVVVELLQNTEGESGGLTSTRLSLADNILSTAFNKS